MGIIYLFKFPNGKHYVGQTTSSFNRRMSQHKSAAKNELPGCTLLYRAIRAHGWDNTTRTILKDNCSEDELDCAELAFIKEYNSMHPNGYNLIEGGGSTKKFSEEAKRNISAGRRGQDTKHHRKSEETRDLPKYITMARNGYRVRRHPYGKDKMFTSAWLDPKENLERAIKYLEELNNKMPQVTAPPKPKRDPRKRIDRELPKYIIKVTNKHSTGYRVVFLQDKSKTISKSFTNGMYPKVSDEKLLEMAIEWLAENKT